jgi:hypothetical protein
MRPPPPAHTKKMKEEPKFKRKNIKFQINLPHSLFKPSLFRRKKHNYELRINYKDPRKMLSSFPFIQDNRKEKYYIEKH